MREYVDPTSPCGSGAVEGNTRNGIISGGVGLAQAHPPAVRKQSSDGLGPVTVHRTHSSVGPRLFHIVSAIECLPDC